MPGRLLSRPDALLLAWTLAAKLGVLALGIVALWWVGGRLPDPLEPWHRWDAPHFTDIAIWGYMSHDPGTLSYPGYRQDFPGDLDLYIVFLPLYPWLVAAVNALIGQPIVAAFVVSTAASLFVAPFLFRLVSVDLGARIGLLTVAFFLVFPTAYFLHIGYTESLFLALSFGSLWLARTDRWWAAGLLAGLAALTRINGLVLAPALAIEAALQWRERRRISGGQVAAVAAVGAGFAVYLAVNQAVYGDPLAFRTIQDEHWYKSLAPPWEAIGFAIRWTGSARRDLAFTYGWMELTFTALGLAAIVAGALRFRPSWTAWMAGNWLLSVSTGFLSSVPRYSLALFGIMVLAAMAAERRPLLGIALGIASTAAMAYFAARFATYLWAF